MRNTASSYGVTYGRPLSRNPWQNTVQPAHNLLTMPGDSGIAGPQGLAGLRGLGQNENVNVVVEQAPLGEMQSFGWILSGAAIGWAASAYSTGSATSSNQFVAAWGGASAGAILLGVRRLVNGDQNGLGPTLLGAALGVAGFYFGEAQRGGKKRPGYTTFD